MSPTAPRASGAAAVADEACAEHRPVLVVDFGAQYAQLIARRVRECRVYSEIVPHDTPAAEVAARDPVGIILSGGPASIYEPGAPAVDPGLFDLGVPVLGICYGMQAMAAALGGEVVEHRHRRVRQDARPARRGQPALRRPAAPSRRPG